ncbi:MAG TPA: NAD-dependent deacylase [Terriglobia bacterium]|nr:NAD-dependent deacylase [Terriglobia bacterium]
MNQNPISTVAERLLNARRVTALTGAGVSAASGIPTFRGAGGVWSQVKAENLATPEAFDRDPKLVWEWYNWRRGIIAGVAPNAAHDVLARWTREWPHFTLITQNVDGLHERAGAGRLLRLHGSIWHVRCRNRCPNGRNDWRDDRASLPQLPPACPHCGALVRPAVVWFGESLDPQVIGAAQAATACDVFLTIGTSSLVYPAAGLTHQSRRQGAFTVEINLEDTPESDLVDIKIQGQAEEVLRELDALMGAGPRTGCTSENQV